MSGGVSSAPWFIAVGLAWAVAADALLAVPGSDARRYAGAVRGLARREARALVSVVRAICARRFGGARRAEEVGLGDVAEMADVIGLGLAAGLSFDGALALYCENSTGPLPRRMARAQLAWRVGAGSRDEELAAAARDMDVPELGSLAVAVGQAVALGAPVAGVLEAQAREMRSAHRAAVERRIERASVKLLVPTGTLILPALLLSIVGPLLAASGMV